MRLSVSESQGDGDVRGCFHCPLWGLWYYGWPLQADQQAEPPAGQADTPEVQPVDECQYDQCAWRLGIDFGSCPDDCAPIFRPVAMPEVHAALEAVDTSVIGRMISQSELRPVCMIPGCGCTGYAHP